VRFVVLTSKPDSPYADTSTSYEYPARYRRFFEALESGQPMIAIIYEPRSGGRGRMSYVGWAALRGVPERSPRVTPAGQPLWEVHYVDRVQEFPNPVPRDYLGQPVEQWLRDMDPANRNVLSSGASVRFLREEEGQFILELGHAGQLGVSTPYEAPEGEVEQLVAERSIRVVEAVARDARFRRDVMSAYEYRCAVTGLTIGSLPQGRATRLLDAAHIRPVSASGSDAVSNGLALTPTVHRLFDEGLVSARWTDSGLELVRSPHLEPEQVENDERGTVIHLETGSSLALPTNTASWPNRDQIRYHQNHIFKGPESFLS
jgi:putative restriction endonuclease